MKTKSPTQNFHLKTVIIFTLFSIVFPNYMEAQIEFTLPNFTVNEINAVGFMYNPTGSNPTRYRLTNAGVQYKSTAIWHNTKICLNENFILRCKLYFGNGNQSYGGDGITFAMHQLASSAGVVGDHGSGLGYSGISPSFAVAFRTLSTTPISRINYVRNGSFASPLATGNIQNTTVRVDTDRWYEVEIHWNVDNGYSLTTYVAEFSTGVLVERCKHNFNQLSNLISTASPSNSLITWGFTAACGAATNIHQVEFIELITNDTFNLILKDNPVGTAKTLTGGGKYKSGSQVIIEAVPDDCYRFLHWTDEAGNIISENQIDTIMLISDSVLIANFERIIGLVAMPNPLVFSDVVQYQDDSKYITLKRNQFAPPIFIDECFLIFGTNFQLENELSGEIILDSLIANVLLNSSTVGEITDTLIVIYHFDFLFGSICWDTLKIPIIANINQYIGGIKFYIRASKHPLTDPTRRNYRIPIFIKADEDISNTVIDSLVVEIDRRIFYPKRVDNGDMSLHFKDTVIKMTFENVTVPSLLANKEEVLLTIRGDVLLGEIDNSEIKIDAVKFAEQLSEKPDLIHGFITLDICAEGANRLVWFDYSPEVIVKNNPVTGGILELQCKTIERGSYSLEIVDMLGKSETVREFTVNVNGKRIFDFEIPISNFSSGAYFIIMNTPTAKYSVGFVVQ